MPSDLNTPEFFRDPYPYYARMRASGKPFWLPHRDSQTACKGIWLFSRYDDAVTVFKTAGLSKDIRSAANAGRASPFDLHMLHRDAPDHLRLRRLAADFFTAGRMAQIEPMVATLAEELLKSLPAGAPVELIKQFAEPLPMRVIAETMAIPRKDLGQLRAWSLELGYGFDSVISDPDVLARQKDAMVAYLGYLRDLIACRREEPGPDLLSHLVAAEGNGQLDQDELVAMAAFLLFAGHETTINLIGNGLWLLMQHPEQMRLLSEHPEWLPGAVEETLRFESPGQRASFRLTTAALEVGDTLIEPGQQVGVIIGSANRDERAFDQPDRFDITRSPNRHLAFGLGAHQCLGMHMARMEARIAMQTLLAVHPDIRPTAEPAVWRRNSFFRGLGSLPAELRH